jgi:hypothetical protein
LPPLLRRRRGPRSARAPRQLAATSRHGSDRPMSATARTRHSIDVVCCGASILRSNATISARRSRLSGCRWFHCSSFESGPSRREFAVRPHVKQVVDEVLPRFGLIGRQVPIVVGEWPAGPQIQLAAVDGHAPHLDPSRVDGRVGSVQRPTLRQQARTRDPHRQRIAEALNPSNLQMQQVLPDHDGQQSSRTKCRRPAPARAVTDPRGRR